MKLSSKAKALIDAAVKDPNQRAALEKYVSHLESACTVTQVQHAATAKAAAKNRRIMRTEFEALSNRVKDKS